MFNWFLTMGYPIFSPWTKFQCWFHFVPFNFVHWHSFFLMTGITNVKYKYFSYNICRYFYKLTLKPGKPYWRGRLSTVNLLIKTARFVKKKKYKFSMISSWSKLVSTRRWTVQSFPSTKCSLLKLKLPRGFPSC